MPAAPISTPARKRRRATAATLRDQVGKGTLRVVMPLTATPAATLKGTPKVTRSIQTVRLTIKVANAVVGGN